jgi:glycosyltransferase involved in cell wall biosynthesis
MMNVLILNRRDPKHPEAGGAEVYTQEIAKGLVSRGARVTIFSSSFEGASPEETIDGIRHLRKGNELTVHLHGFFFAYRNRHAFDLIIDEFNGLGFFCFLLPRSMILIHQMYKEFWFRVLSPVGFIPYVIEPLLLRCYRRKPAVTVSDSTKKDLESLGFGDIHIVMNALSVEPLPEVARKEERPTLLFLGRLKATKKPEDAITIFRSVKSGLPEAQLWIVGRGPDEKKLRRMAEGINDITFRGWVSEEEKFDLLQRAHVLVVPGVREGFGINVIEAASRGTPAVGYDIHGLRDSIRDGRTGMLAHGPDDAAHKVLDLLRNSDRYRAVAQHCLVYARDFNWEKRADQFWQVVKGLKI